MGAYLSMICYMAGMDVWNLGYVGCFGIKVNGSFVFGIWGLMSSLLVAL